MLFCFHSLTYLGIESGLVNIRVSVKFSVRVGVSVSVKVRVSATVRVRVIVTVRVRDKVRLRGLSSYYYFV